MPTNLEQIRERAQSWSAAISLDAPTGSSAKQLPDYERVVQEIAKLQSPAEAASVDWQRIVESGRGILQTKSKDLPLAAYVTMGLQATTGLPGLLEGTLALGDLLDRYWPNLFPEIARTRARANALTWFVERASGVLSNPAAGPGGLGGADRELLLALQEATERLGRLSREKLANDSPGFGPLLKAVEQLVQSAPEAAQAAPAPQPGGSTQPTAAAPAPGAAAPAAAAPTLSNPADPAGYLREMGGSLIAAAAQLRRANPIDPAGYRALRAGLWLHLDAAPSGGADGRTSLPPLPPAKRTQLDAMTTHGKWAELLEESEAALLTNRFNLDLQRYSAKALEMLGPGYQAARAAALAELSAWLRRVPAVSDLIANDGTPMADAETKTWLDREVKSGPASGDAAPTDATPSASTEADQKLLNDARTLAVGKKFAEAIDLVQVAIDATPSGKAKFGLRLFLAKLCADAGLQGAAKALYHALDEQSLQHNLDVWEPALSAQCLEGLLRSARGDRGPLPPEYAPQLQRLCRLSPVAALSANGLLARR